MSTPSQFTVDQRGRESDGTLFVGVGYAPHQIVDTTEVFLFLRRIGIPACKIRELGIRAIH